MANIKPVILSVDDDRSIGMLLTVLLKKAGYEPVAVQSAEEGLDVLTGRDVDVIVSDFMMPDMNGMEFLRAVKAFGKKAPFIMLTSEKSLSKAMSAIREGAFDYVRKPIDKDELLVAVRRAVEFRNMRR